MVTKYRSMLLGGTMIMVVTVLLTIVDFILAGRMLGEEALAGVNLVAPLSSAAYFMTAVFTLGIPIMYSKEMGKFAKDKADQVFGFGLLISIILGVLLFLTAFFGGDAYLRFFNIGDTVYSYAKAYLFWTCFVFLIMPIQSFISSMLFADGDETLASTADIVQAVGNLPLSIFLCKLMGAQGLALGTFLTTLISLAICSLHFLKKTNTLTFNIYFSGPLMVSVVKYSLIDSVSYIFIAVFSAAIEKYCVYRFGEEMLVVASVIVTLTELRLVFDGVGEAITPIMTVYLSEGAFAGVKNIYKHARTTSIIEGVALSLLVVAGAPLLTSILGITGEEVVSLSIDAARITSFGYVFFSILYLLSSYYTLRDKIALGFAICGLRDIVISLPFAVVLGNIYGIYGMFVGLAIAPAAATIVSMVYVASKYGVTEYPLLIGNLENSDKSLLFEFDITPEEVIRIRDEIETALKAHSYTHETVIRTMLLVEELFILVHDINDGKLVLGECSITMDKDRIEVIEKDNGKPFDLTDKDMPVTSLRVYFITNLTSNITISRRHLTTVSSNRNVFEVKAEREVKDIT